MDIKSIAFGASLLVSMPVMAQDGFYTSVNILGVKRQVNDMTLTSPRVNDRISSPRTTNRINGSLAAGFSFAQNYRAEIEYTLPSSGRYVARWAPFVNNDNVLNVRSQRVMFNAYRHWELANAFSLYAMVGAGGVWARAGGWQTRPDRAFAKRTTFRPAYSVGVGMSYRIMDGLDFDAGYRHVRAGQFSTGRNRFVNAALARDEQLQGRLREHNVYAGLRKSF